MTRKQIADALKAARAEAAQLWNAFDDAKRKSVTSGDDLSDTSSPAFKKLEEAHVAYETVAARCKRLEADLMKAIDAEGGEWLDPLTGDRVYRAPGKAVRPSGFAKAFLDGIGGVKALDATVGGTAVPPFFDPDVRNLPSRRLFVRSVIPTLTTDSDKVDYLRQTVRPDSAAPVAAGAQKPTSVATLQRVTERVRTIATLSEALDRSLLLDVGQLTEFLELEFRLAVLREEEEQILTGDGTGENFTGILNTVGIGTQPLGADSRSDAVYKAITLVRLQFLEPDAVVVHPSDWQDLRLEKTADGEYLAAPVIEADPDRLWGVPVVTSAAMPAGTSLVGAFAESATIYDREQTRITWAETGIADVADSDLFGRNQLRLRAESRLALVVSRPAGFVEVTGV